MSATDGDEPRHGDFHRTASYKDAFAGAPAPEPASGGAYSGYTATDPAPPKKMLLDARLQGSPRFPRKALKVAASSSIAVPSGAPLPGNQRQESEVALKHDPAAPRHVPTNAPAQPRDVLELHGGDERGKMSTTAITKGEDGNVAVVTAPTGRLPWSSDDAQEQGVASSSTAPASAKQQQEFEAAIKAHPDAQKIAASLVDDPEMYDAFRKTYMQEQAVQTAFEAALQDDPQAQKLADSLSSGDPELYMIFRNTYMKTAEKNLHAHLPRLTADVPANEAEFKASQPTPPRPSEIPNVSDGVAVSKMAQPLHTASGISSASSASETRPHRPTFTSDKQQVATITGLTGKWEMYNGREVDVEEFDVDKDRYVCRAVSDNQMMMLRENKIKMQPWSALPSDTAISVDSAGPGYPIMRQPSSSGSWGDHGYFDTRLHSYKSDDSLQLIEMRSDGGQRSSYVQSGTPRQSASDYFSSRSSMQMRRSNGYIARASSYGLRLDQPPRIQRTSLACPLDTSGTSMSGAPRSPTYECSTSKAKSDNVPIIDRMYKAIRDALKDGCDVDEHDLEYFDAQTSLSDLLQGVDKVEFDVKGVFDKGREREAAHHVKSDEWSCNGTVTVYDVTQNDREGTNDVAQTPKGKAILRLHYKAEKGLFFDNGNMDCYIETITEEASSSDTSIKLAEFSREKGASKFNPNDDWMTSILIGETVYAHVINNEFRRIDASGGLWRYQKTCQLKTQIWGLSYLCFLPTLGIGSAWCCMKAARTDTQIGLTNLEGSLKFSNIIVKPNGNTVCELKFKGDPMQDEAMPEMAYKIDLLLLAAFGVGERVTRRPPNV